MSGAKSIEGQNWTHTHRFGLKLRPNRSHRCSGSDGMDIFAPNQLPRLVFDGFGAEFGFSRGCYNLFVETTNKNSRKAMYLGNTC